MNNTTKTGVDVYRIRGYEFVLPSTYAETPIIITMEYLNAKMDRIKGRLYANHYGDYKPVFLNEFTIEGISAESTNREIEDAFHNYIVEGYDPVFQDRIKLFIAHIPVPETKSEFELRRFDLSKERQGKLYGLFFYLPKHMSANNVEITISYKKNAEGKLDMISYLSDAKIPYRVKLSSGTTAIEFNDPYRDSLVFDQFQYDKEVQSVIESWDILRDHMK